MKKRILKIIASIIVVIAIVVIFTPKKETKLILLRSRPKKMENINKKYLSTTNWSKVGVPYKVAVEVDDFKGDILNAGTYDVSINNGTTYRGVVPIRMNLYIAKDHANPQELTKVAKPTLKLGGPHTNDDTHKITVKKGDYIYLLPPKITEKQSGYIQLELK